MKLLNNAGMQFGLQQSMRPLHNSLICHSGLDPESNKQLIILDSRFCGNDKIAIFFSYAKVSAYIKEKTPDVKLRRVLQGTDSMKTSQPEDGAGNQLNQLNRLTQFVFSDKHRSFFRVIDECRSHLDLLLCNGRKYS